MPGLFPRVFSSFLGGKGKGGVWSRQPRQRDESAIVQPNPGTFPESIISQRHAPAQAGGAESSAHPQPSSPATLQYQGVLLNMHWEMQLPPLSAPVLPQSMALVLGNVQHHQGSGNKWLAAALRATMPRVEELLGSSGSYFCSNKEGGQCLGMGRRLPSGR